jgi:preprotein translocase subunit SecF
VSENKEQNTGFKDAINSVATVGTTAILLEFSMPIGFIAGLALYAYGVWSLSGFILAIVVGGALNGLASIYIACKLLKLSHMAVESVNDPSHDPYNSLRNENYPGDRAPKN